MNWSLIKVLPLASRTARVGKGPDGLLPARIASVELPEHLAGFIGLDNAAVIRVSDKRVAVGEAAGKGHAAKMYASGAVKRGHDGAWQGMRDLDGSIAVLIGDQNVAVGEQLGSIGIVKLACMDQEKSVYQASAV